MWPGANAAPTAPALSFCFQTSLPSATFSAISSPFAAGQISFPGGRIEPGEESLAAALREAHEEVGLEPSRADVMGRLGETLVLASAFRLTPWVASVPYPYPYAPSPGEVEEILHVPLSALSRPGAHRVEQRVVYGLDLDVHFFTVGADVIWGATARVLAELLTLWRTA